MSKDSTLSLRIPSELKAALERLAKGDQRSVAYYVESVLAAHVRMATQGDAGGKLNITKPAPKLVAAEPDPRALVARALEFSKRPARPHPKPISKGKK